MKIKDYFSKERTKELKVKINELYLTATEELGISDLEEFSVKQMKSVFTKVHEYIIANIAARGEVCNNIRLALEALDLSKTNELKSNISTNEYMDILALLFYSNSANRNDDIVKFLLTNTEIAEFNSLKKLALCSFLEIIEEEDYNGEIIELMINENPPALKIFFSKIQNQLEYPSKYVPDQFLINTFFSSIPDINELIIVTRSNNGGQYQFRTSLLRLAMETTRLELAKWLVGQGACLSSEDFTDVLGNPDIPDELIISSLEGALSNHKSLIISDINEKKSSDPLQKWFLPAIKCNRLELTKWLVDSGGVNCNPASFDGNVANRHYVDIFTNPNCFKILVVSDKLNKTIAMCLLSGQIGDTVLKLNEWYDLFKWEDRFDASIKESEVSFKNWHDEGKLFKIYGLFESIKKLLDIQVMSIESKVVQGHTLLPRIQKGYSEKPIKTFLNKIIPEVKADFIENWHQIRLVCKDITAHEIFSIKEFRCLIGQELFNSFLPFELSDQVVDVTGADNNGDEAVWSVT